jgi:hypothetical protein
MTTMIMQSDFLDELTRTIIIELLHRVFMIVDKLLS